MSWSNLEGRRARHDYAEQQNWHDPLNDLTKKPLPAPRPDTAAYIAFISGTLTPDSSRDVWKAFPAMRTDMERYATNRAQGWAA